MSRLPFTWVISCRTATQFDWPKGVLGIVIEALYVSDSYKYYLKLVDAF